jgi:hypothetical protein
VRAFALVVCLVLSGCTSGGPAAPSAPVNVQVTVGVGQTVDVPEAALRLRFVEVLNDSRCPADAVCIQGGDAIVRIDVISTVGGSATYDLHTGDMKPVMYGSLTIALVELNPYPFSSRPAAPGDYRGTFRVTR